MSRYGAGDKVEAWLNDLLCLDAAEHIPPPPPQLPHPSDCELYYVERDTLFSYHKVLSLITCSFRVKQPGLLSALHSSADNLGDMMVRCKLKGHAGVGGVPAAHGGAVRGLALPQHAQRPAADGRRARAPPLRAAGAPRRDRQRPPGHLGRRPGQPMYRVMPYFIKHAEVFAVAMPC